VIVGSGQSEGRCLEFTNDFHDAANAIATLVATRGARPGAAITLAAVCNLLGPLLLGRPWPTRSRASPR
jgi:phosphate/sulfate permease